MAGDQFAVVRHQHRHRPAELGHRARDLRDLVRAVRLGVAGIRLQPLERPLLDALRSEAQGHSGSSCRWAGGSWRVDSGTGSHWAAVGLLQGSGGSHPQKGASHCFIDGYRVRRWIPEAGWLPKNSRLSLANRRASPSRIRNGAEGTKGKSRSGGGGGGGRNFNGLAGGPRTSHQCRERGGWTPVLDSGVHREPVTAPARRPRGAADHTTSRPAVGPVPAPASSDARRRWRRRARLGRASRPVSGLDCS